jgi:hypothetical protein
VSQREAKLKAATGHTLPFWSWEIILSIVIFATVAGARYHTGFDHAMYLSQYVSYQKYGFFTRDFEPLFMWVTQLMAGAHIHYFFYFALWATIELTLLYYALNSHKSLIPWVALIIVLGPTFVHLMNTIRQGVVECAVPLLLILARDRRLTLFIVLVALLAMVHYTALVLFALLLIPKRICSHPSMGLLLMVVVLAVGVGMLPIWVDYIKRMSEYLLTYFGGYNELFNIQGNRFILSVGPLRLLTYSVQILTIAFASQALKHKNNPFWTMMLICSVVFVGGVSLFANTSNYYQRPFELFSGCFVIMSAFVIMFFLHNRRRFMAMGALLLNCSFIFLALYKAWQNPSPVNTPFLYHFFF